MHERFNQMTAQQAYLVVVSNMTGCIVSLENFAFSCVVYADSMEDARGWGIQVTSKYADRFGLPPGNQNPDRDEIIRNTCVMECNDPSRYEHQCKFGSYPAALQ